MTCPSWDELHDLASGDCADAERDRLIAHVKACESCISEICHLVSIYRAIGKRVQADPCPNEELLSSFADGQLAAADASPVEEHLAHCSRCRFWLEAGLHNAPGRGQAQDFSQPLTSEEYGRQLAEDALERLMPGSRPLFDALWGRVASLVEELRTMPLASWPALRTHPQALQGVHFANVPEPEIVAAAVILATMCALAHQVFTSETTLEASSLKRVARSLSSRFGAGSQLTARLADVAAELLLD